MGTDLQVVDSGSRRGWQVVVAMAVIAVAVFFVAKSHHAAGTSDVNVAVCRHSQFGTSADVSTVNSASKPADYYFSVVFVENGVTLDRQSTVVVDVPPGGSDGATLISGRIGADIQCRVTGVTRDTSTP